MNIKMYILVQQKHIRLSLKLAKTRKLIVIWRPSWDLKNRYYFLNMFVITQIEFMNIKMYILVQQETHSSKLEISKNTQVNCHLAAILDFYDISMNNTILSSTEDLSLM